MDIIVNTTVISNYGSVGQLQLLPLLWERLYISDQVWSEIQAGLAEGYDFYAGIEKIIFPLTETGWLHLTALNTSEEFRLLGKLSTTLHAGEASSIAIAHYRKWTFLSDDKAARTACRQLNVPVSGTIGILLSLVKHNYLNSTQANTLLQQMIQLGYRSPVNSLNEILQKF
ncbi:MAG: DUF3368 domain-containing protein [Chloroflexi bacterium]|nr:DUF3368 domain-containing protein [Chloroflexota bacterium]